jgi:hypothetical protein
MRRRRRQDLIRLALLASGVAGLLTLPVLAQQSGPESLLPEGFGEPQPETARPVPTSRPTEAAPRPTPAASPIPPTGSLAETAPDALPADPDALFNEMDAADATDETLASEHDLPPKARRSLATVGPLTPKLGGLGAQAFGPHNGLAMARIMAATRAPIVSRWASILLRRALLSQSETPAGIDGADWVAERAWLLLRMGEADNARLLIQGVDNDRYSKRLYAVAMQSLLASADPAGFCSLLPRARDFSGEPSWFMAQAICASFAADQNSATAILNQAQRRGIARGIDYRLAEKTVGAGPESRRSVKIEWDGVNRLTSWRFGLATANNVPIPDPLYQTVGPQVRAWEARAPMLPLIRRLPGTMAATRLGVFSGSAAQGFLSQLAEAPEAEGPAQDVIELLRTAYASGSNSERAAAMRQYWSHVPADGAALGPGAVDYGALPVIARAAATMEPDTELGSDVPWLIAAMLSGGYDRNAARWSRVAETLKGPARQRSWALLATGVPGASVPLSTGRIGDFQSQDESANRRLSALLVAALGGLDRLPVDDRADLLADSRVDPVPRTKWARALMAAAARGEKGTVALLVGVGLQSHGWRGVPPGHLFFITSALRRAGLAPFARMIAAEAITRGG